MRTALRFIFASLLIGCCAMNGLCAESANGARVVDLSGSAYERGLQHGTLLKGEIASLMEKWKDDLTQRFGVSAEEFIRRFLAVTDYQPAIQKWTPTLWDELRGIADGAGAPFDTILVFNLVDEYWLRGKMAGEHCSSVGVRKRNGEPTIVAQNLDLESFRDGFQVVLRIKEENSAELVITFPGFIGASGVNSAGLAVVPNTLDQLANAPTGLPVAFVIRGILSQRNVAAAEKFLRSVRHASGQNYLVGDPTQIKDFECSAGKVMEYGRGEPVIFHTNHPLANRDFTPAWEAVLKTNPAALKEPGNSVLRLQSLQSRASSLKSNSRITAVQTMLAAKDSAAGAVCRTSTPAGAFTFASTIMILGAAPELRIAAGPPDVNPYHTVKFAP